MVSFEWWDQNGERVVERYRFFIVVHQHQNLLVAKFRFLAYFPQLLHQVTPNQGAVLPVESFLYQLTARDRVQHGVRVFLCACCVHPQGEDLRDRLQELLQVWPSLDQHCFSSLLDLLKSEITSTSM